MAVKARSKEAAETEAAEKTEAAEIEAAEKTEAAETEAAEEAGAAETKAAEEAGAAETEAAEKTEAVAENKPSLEELFEGLDEVIAKLEREEVSLEESFRLYEKGMKLLEGCNAVIDTVEKKVQILDEDGEVHDF